MSLMSFDDGSDAMVKMPSSVRPAGENKNFKR
jgi:hypothetical protein